MKSSGMAWKATLQASQSSSIILRLGPPSLLLHSSADMCYVWVMNQMQTRMDAEIDVYSKQSWKPGDQKCEVQNEIDYSFAYQIHNQNQRLELQNIQKGTRQNQNQKTKGCLVQFLNKLAYTKLAQNMDQRSDREQTGRLEYEYTRRLNIRWGSWDVRSD